METTTVPQEAPYARRAPRWWFRLPAAVRRRIRALRASEPHLRTVWVVAFCPYRERASIGGLEWREDWAEADALYERFVAESLECGGCHEVRLLPYRTTLTGDDLTREIDADLDLIEADEFGVSRRFIP